MTFNHKQIIKESTAEALKVLEKHAPIEYKRLLDDKSKKDTILGKAEKAAREEVSLAEKLHGQKSLENITSILISHLPPAELKQIKAAFEFETYKMHIHPSEKHPTMFLTRSGKESSPPKQLITLEDVDSASAMQIASLLIEIVQFLLQVMGIEVKLDEQAIDSIAKGVEDLMEEPVMTKALNALKEAWEKSKGSRSEQAKAIFLFLKDSYSAGTLWKSAKLILKSMPWQEYAESIAMLTAMLAATFATDGIALIAKIAMALDGAYNITKKMANLTQLTAIRNATV